jgi:hypothetical protein
MSTLQSSKTNGNGVVNPPFLESLKASSVTYFLSGVEDYKRSVRSYNETAPVHKREIERRMLDLIHNDVREQILHDTLPSTLVCLQEFYPDSRIFWTQSQGQSTKSGKELSESARLRARILFQQLRETALEQMRSEAERLQVDVARNAPNAHNDNANANANAISHVDSHRAIDLQRRIDELSTISLQDLAKGRNAFLNSFLSPNPLRDVLWDEELIKILFQQIMHDVVSDGQISFKDLLKDLKIDWTEKDLPGRISDFLTKVNAIFKKHSLNRVWEKGNIEHLMTYLKSTWPVSVQDVWENQLLTNEDPIKCLDTFTVALKKLSLQVKVLTKDQVHISTKQSQTHDPKAKLGHKNANRMHKRKRSESNNYELSPPPNYNCAACGQKAGHWPQNCPARTPDQKNLTKDDWIKLAIERKKQKNQDRNNKKSKHKDSRSQYTDDDPRIFMARAQESGDHFLSTLVHSNKECVLKTILDSGSDENILTTSALFLLGISLPAGMDENETPSVELANGRIELTKGVVSVEVIRLADRLVLQDVKCIVLDNPEPLLLVGRPTMKSLGIDPQRDLNILLGNTTIDADDEILDDEDDDLITIPQPEELTQAIEALKVRTRLSLEKENQSEDTIKKFQSLIDEFRKIFRIGLDKSPPIRVESYKPSMKPGKGPVRAVPRKYNPRQRTFLRETVQKLCDLGLLKQNPRSKWSSPVFLPPKKDSFRFTVDSRQVNACIEPRAWPLPFLEFDLEKAVNAGYYAVLDADNGYFQIKNDEEFAEIFSILTEDGIFTPTRLVQGTVDGVAVFQSSMMTILADQLHRTVAIWIDDIIVFESNPLRLLAELRAVFKAFAAFGVKINPNKCTLFSTEIQFCGKLISINGIIPNNEFIQGLKMMSSPKTVGELQQFLAASNWIRNHIPNYGSLFKPLQDLLLKFTKQTGSSKAKKLVCLS